MMKGCVGKQGTNVWNPGRCGGRNVHHQQFYFKCYLEVEEFEFGVSARSWECHCLPQKQHRLISWSLPWMCVGGSVSWLYSPTKNLRDGNCCHARGQLLPGLATYISGTASAPRRGMGNSQQVVYTMHSLRLEGSLKWRCIFNQLFHPLSWGQCCSGLQRTQHCYLQGHRERISGLPKGEENCLIY